MDFWQGAWPFGAVESGLGRGPRLRALEPQAAARCISLGFFFWFFQFEF